VNAVLATFRRELRAYFFSPLAYVVLCLFLLTSGIIFIGLMSLLNDPRSPGGPPFTFFFRTTWLVLLLVVPALTMRLVSEELRSGSIEVLMTAPVTEGQVITGKFLAALTFYAFLWVPTAVYALSIHFFEKVDWGPVGAGYLGILLIGALFLAIGLFASALTRSQLLAAMLTVSILLPFFLVSLFQDLVSNDMVKKTLEYINVGNHIDEFADGIVDSRRLVFYLSGTLFFLFLASRALEDKKWR
jgi:gliding motility-associated transport system permease protein